MALPALFVAILQRAGRAIPNSDEVALERADALQAVAALAGSNVAVLGGDVYLLAGEVPVIGYDHWFCDRRFAESRVAYLERSRSEAERYLHTYATRQPVLFRLLVAEQSE